MYLATRQLPRTTLYLYLQRNMIINFHLVKDRLPETFTILGSEISVIVPVVTKTGLRVYASTWDGTWRESYSGTIIKNVTHWGEVIED